MSHSVLRGDVIRLEPYAEALKAGVKTALDCDLEAWQLFSRAGFGDHFATWWETALENTKNKTALSFAICRQSDDRVVGTTSFLNLRPFDLGVEIGATFLHPDVRSTAVNPEAKRLMLSHAFGGGLFGMPANRVDIITDLLNDRSQAAIAKLGAVREGVLRRHKKIWTDRVRDTVVFSILADEWPPIDQALSVRLGNPHASTHPPAVSINVS